MEFEMVEIIAELERGHTRASDSPCDTWGPPPVIWLDQSLADRAIRIPEQDDG